MTCFVSSSVDITLRSVCSGRSDDSYSTNSVHESSGVRVDGALERPSTTDGQTSVDRSGDEQETSRQEQLHHTDLTPDMAAARWADTAASTSTDHQSHDSTVGEQGGASTVDAQTSVD